MRIKANFILPAVLAAISVFSSHAPKIIPEGNSLIAAAAGVATLSIPSKSAAAIMPARIVRIAAISMSQTCEAGVMDQLCASVTSFLDEESAKADAAAKACKKNCRWKKSKDDLIDSARKKAKESCARGEAPDINELNKGLNGNAKDKLKKLYDSNSRMFDGSAKLPDKDFEPTPSKQTALLTGKSGLVADLKSSGPDIPKLSQVSEFSLAKPSTLLASTKTAVAATAKVADPCPSPGTVKDGDCCCSNNKNKCFGGDMCYSVCMDILLNPANCPPKFWIDFVTVISNLSELAKIEWESIKTIFFNPWQFIKAIPRAVWDALTYIFGNIWNAIKAVGGWIEEKYHKLVKDEIRCGKSWYNQDKQCCVDAMIFKKCNGKCIPPSEFAVLKNDKCSSSYGAYSYCKDYNIYFRNSQHLDLDGVQANEELRAKQTIDSRPICVMKEPILQFIPLEKGSNGLFGITDELSFKEFTTTVSCAHKREQIVSVNGCPVQTNTLTFEADADRPGHVGARRISRSDEVKK